jgi:hypothetical protein
MFSYFLSYLRLRLNVRVRKELIKKKLYAIPVEAAIAALILLPKRCEE